MTTETVQHEENVNARAPLPPVEYDAAAREPLPPVEQAVASHALVEEHVAVSPAPAVSHDVSHAHTQTPATPPAAQATGVAGWLSRNRWFTKEPITNIGYQFVRATFATIPYGFGMAFGHHGFGLLSVKGQKMGLTEDGIKAFSSSASGLANVEKAVSEASAAAVAAETALKGNLSAAEKVAAELVGQAKIFKPGLGGAVGRGLMRVANSPLNAAVQIALGFTMFRFTGGVVKNLRDRVMNEKNTPEQTVAEVKHAGKTIWETMKINWPAESTGTPIAALVLGFMSSAFTPVMRPVRDTSKTFLNQVGELWSPKSKLLQNAAVWTFSYSLFFLMAESLFKDKQIQLGRWKGHPNSLKNGPDDTVGGPGAVAYTPPEHKQLDAPKLTNASFIGSAEDGYKKDDEYAKDSHEKLRYPGLTGEPSIGRFLIRRVAPVAVGISAYAALKRVGYIANIPFKGMQENYLADTLAAAEKGVAVEKAAWNGPMEPISVKVFDALNKAETTMGKIANHAKLFGKNAYREGKATIMFGALWACTDAWGGFYDKFVHNLQKPENQVPLNDHQQANHADLLARLNEKDKVTGRAA